MLRRILPTCLLYLLVILAFSFVTTGHSSAAASCTEVAQYGITFSFDKAYSCGTFANGDSWVVPNAGDSGVKITRMSPDYASGRNGWQVNPTSFAASGYDSRSDSYSASLIPNTSLSASNPYNAAPNSSIIKAISPTGTCNSNQVPCITTASVLTVLAAAPPNDGANIFRPAYAGTAKRLFTTSQLKTTELPSLAPVAGAPTLDQVASRYQRVQVDNTEGWAARTIHASLNYYKFSDPASLHDYGSELATDNNDAALRLMLNDTTAQKMPALINYVQYGIDTYGLRKAGMTWYPDGGHQLGRKLPLTFAAILLDDADMKTAVSSAKYGTFSEDGDVYFSTAAGGGKVYFKGAPAGMALFGSSNCSTGDYQAYLTTGKQAKDCRDPAGLIDGGKPSISSDYQACCISEPLKGASIASRLMPDVRALWNYEPLNQYIDRWVDFGLWTKPDSQNRFIDIHGTGADDGSYSSPFQNNMFSTYQSQVGDTFLGKDGQTGGSEPKRGDFTNDGSVTAADANFLVTKWNSTSATTQDLNSDGKVGIVDLSIVLSLIGS